MKKNTALLLSLALLLPACTGSFTLARKVYKFNRNFDDPWVEELVFLGLIIVPVYEVSLILDMVIFNTVEFWTGENPVADAGAQGTRKVVRSGDQEAVLTYLPDGCVKIETADRTFVLERTDSGVIAKSLDGKTLYKASKSADGTVSLFDDSGKLIRTFEVTDWMPPGL